MTPTNIRADFGRETDAPPPQSCTAARLRKLTRRVTAFYEHHMRSTGLKLSQFSLLAQLSAAPQTLTALADHMEIDRTTLTRNLRPLIERGLVAESSGTDARQRFFALTPAGAQLRTQARKHWRQAQRALETNLGADFVANLHTQLEQALTRLKPSLPEAN